MPLPTALPAPELPTAEVVRALREQVRVCSAAARGGLGEPVSSGHAVLDRLLPEGAFRRGALVEWLSAGHGSGACSLALLAAGQACREGGALVVLDRRRGFYPPGAVCRGIDLAHLLVVRPANPRDEAWAIDQTLHSPGVAAVLCWPEKLDDRTFRRWQLAAETSGVLGLLLRGETARSSPSWAEWRLWVSALAGRSTARRLRVELLRCPTGTAGGVVELEIE